MNGFRLPPSSLILRAMPRAGFHFTQRTILNQDLGRPQGAIAILCCGVSRFTSSTCQENQSIGSSCSSESHIFVKHMLRISEHEPDLCSLCLSDLCTEGRDNLVQIADNGVVSLSDDGRFGIAVDGQNVLGTFAPDHVLNSPAHATGNI